MNSENDSTASTAVGEKFSAGHKRLRKLMTGGKISIPSCNVLNPDDNMDMICLDKLNPTEKCDKDKEIAPIDAWFFKKLPNGGKKVTTKGLKNDEDFSKYNRYRRDVEEKLSMKRREDMESRHSFYNAENEIFEEQDEEEEDEEEEEAVLSDEEEQETQASTAENSNDGIGFAEGGVSGKESRKRSHEPDDSAPEAKHSKFGGGSNEFDDEEEDSGHDDLLNDEDVHEDADIECGGISSSSNNDHLSTGVCAVNESVLQPSGRLDSTSSEEQFGSNDSVDPLPVVNKEDEISEKIFTEDDAEDNLDSEGNSCGNESNSKWDGQKLASHDSVEEKRITEKFVKSSLFDNHNLFTVDDDAGDDAVPVSEYMHDYESPNEDDDLDDGQYSNASGPGKRVKLKDMLDDEASLSDDDMGTDNEEDDDENEYEVEEGDNDEELPDEEVIRENLIRQYMKQTNDDEERRVLQLQEHFFTDSDFHDSKNNDRSFRVRMRKDDANIDWKKVLGKMDHVNDEDAGEEDENFDEGKIEKLKWKLEQEKNKENAGNSTIEPLIIEQNSLLCVGEELVCNDDLRIIPSGVLTSVIHESSTSTTLLAAASITHRDSLRNKKILDYFTTETSETRTHSLFVSKSTK